MQFRNNRVKYSVIFAGKTASFSVMTWNFSLVLILTFIMDATMVIWIFAGVSPVVDPIRSQLARFTGTNGGRPELN